MSKRTTLPQTRLRLPHVLSFSQFRLGRVDSVAELRRQVLPQLRHASTSQHRRAGTYRRKLSNLLR